MSVNTLTYDRKVRQRKQANERAAERRAALFRNASKALKRKPVGNIDEYLSYEKQAQLLQEYVDKLEKDLAKFNALYPDQDGRSSAILIKRERTHALSELARLLILIARGEQNTRPQWR